jgi:hypothetical protein
MTHKLCGAKTRAGGTCKQPALPNGRCRFHGGHSLAGIASPNFKTGKYSKYLPARLAERYHEARSDPELLALRDEISLVDARLEDLIRRVDTGESGEAWGIAAGAFAALRKAITDQNTADMLLALDTLGKVINRGMSDYAAWGEIGSQLEQRRRLVESERKRLVDMAQVITSERAMLLIGAITDVIRRNVHDRAELNAINQELSSLLNQRRQQEALTE